MREYIDFVQTLKPDGLHDDTISLNGWSKTLNDFAKVGQRLDMIKKAVAYGKRVPSPGKRVPSSGPGGDSLLHPTYTDRRLDPIMAAVQEDTLHGILGIATEAAELAEIIRRPPADGIDTTNLLEELGDVMWYIALVARDNDWTFEDIMETNMAKLRKRYPDKFTQEAAIDRDVDAERDVLEARAKSLEERDYKQGVVIHGIDPLIVGEDVSEQILSRSARYFPFTFDQMREEVDRRAIRYFDGNGVEKVTRPSFDEVHRHMVAELNAGMKSELESKDD